MIKILHLKLTVLLFVFAFTAKADITFQTIDYKRTGRQFDTLSIDAVITSIYSLDTVKATIGNKTVILVRANSFDNDYIGTMSLNDVAQGQLQLIISAKDILGNVKTENRTFVFDRLPTISVIYPLRYSSYQQSKIRLKATVHDPGNVNCTGTIYYGGIRITFVNSIDTVADFPPGITAKQFNIVFYAIDNAGQNSPATFVPVFLDESKFLKPYFTSTGPGQVIDFKGTRALVLDKDTANIPHLTIVSTTGGPSETVNLGNNLNSKTFVMGVLLDNGAGLLLNYKNTLEGDSVYVWKSGALNNVSRIVHNSSAVPELHHFHHQPTRLQLPYCAIRLIHGMWFPNQLPQQLLRKVIPGSFTSPGPGLSPTRLSRLLLQRQLLA